MEPGTKSQTEPGTKSQKFRRYCFTINNYTEEDYIKCINLINTSVYGIVGKEIGEKNGTPHLQGFVRFKNPRGFEAIRKNLGRAHIIITKGTDEENQKYCRKEGSYYEFGTPIKEDEKQQGRRNDIITAKEIIDNGGKMRDIVENVNSYQAVRMAELILKYKEKKRDYKPYVEWFVGETGSGKTKTAIETFKNTDYYVSGKNLKWWEGYDGEENIILDDFRADFCTFHELLRILDRYEYRIEVKGGSRQFLGKHIIITSAYHPETVYNKTEEDLAQLLRRIDNIRYFEKIEIPLEQNVEQEVRGNSRNPDFLEEEKIDPMPAALFPPSADFPAVEAKASPVPKKVGRPKKKLHWKQRKN